MPLRLLINPNGTVKLLRDSYYLFKPIMPRWFQIYMRRKIVQTKRLHTFDIWPIDQSAARSPERWSGWPERKDFALVLTHDVESAKGHMRSRQLLDLDRDLGFQSSFNFVGRDYEISQKLYKYIRGQGYEIGVHGLHHNETLFKSRSIFQEQAEQINMCLREWNCVGFRAPCMYRNLEWIGDLDIEYDCSSFDTDPFEPQPDGLGTIFPLWIQHDFSEKGYVELPYTLAQDFTLFVLMQEKTIELWQRKLDWIVEHGGMALLITHPDYMCFDGKKPGVEEYPSRLYQELLQYIQSRYAGRYWNPLPREIARFWAQNYSNVHV